MRPCDGFCCSIPLLDEAALEAVLSNNSIEVSEVPV
jgi:hypothetical protein